MDAAALLRSVRTRAGLRQRALAEAAGTSQSAVAAIESGRKQPTVATLDRLLQAAGTELVPAPPEHAALLRRSRRLEDVLHLAEALPFRRSGGAPLPPGAVVTTLVEKVACLRRSDRAGVLHGGPSRYPGRRCERLRPRL